MDSQQQLKAAKILAVTTSLLASGAILSISFYSVPILSSSRSSTFSLHQLRSLFSSGSHVFPPAAMASSALFGYLGYVAPAGGPQRNAFFGAAVAILNIVPFTLYVMVPAANGRLIEMEERAKKHGKAGVDVSGGDREVKEMLERFKWLNLVRAILVATGGALGLYACIA